MPESLVPVPQWKKDRCEFCKAGWDRGGGTHFPTALGVDPIMNCKPCTAPTEREYIEELEARLKESVEDTAIWCRLTQWLQEKPLRRVSILHNVPGPVWNVTLFSFSDVFHGDCLVLRDSISAAIDAARGVKP